MTTKFPAQIDSFAIHVPQEIIRAQHVNDLQEATVAIEVFCKSLQEALNNHINDNSNVYAASAIGLDSSINGMTNVFTALQDINTRFNGHVSQATAAHAASAISITPIPFLSGTNVQTALANLQVQLNNLSLITSSSNLPVTIVERDGSGSFAAGTITATSFVGPLTGNVTGNVSGSSATFTGNLLGDVTGTQSATVVSTVGGSTASLIHSAELAANAATSTDVSPTGTPAFGTARTYAILGASAVTGSTGVGSTLAGNLGISPGTSITNFPPSTFTGTEDINNAAASTAHASAQTAYTDLSTRPVGTTESVLDGLTLTPGTYTSASSMSLAASGPATLTLNGAGVYIFQIGSTLTTGAGGTPTILLTNGATAANVYWAVGSSATINSGFSGTFQGNVIAQASITVTTGGTVNGTLATLAGAVTLSATTAVNVQALISSSSANTIVKRDASGNFSAGTITANLNGNATTATTATNVAENALLGTDGYVVGTESVQILENKTIISDFVGSKIILFTDVVSEQEEAIYDSSSPSANQLEVRQKAVSTITSVTGSLVTVPAASFFSDVIGVSMGIQFIVPPYPTPVTYATVTSIVNATTIQLDSTYPLVVSNGSTTSSGQVIINKVKATPLFYVGSDGYVYANQLTVANSSFNNIKLQDDVAITGTLSVSGITQLSSSLNILGASSNLTVGGSGTIASTLSVSGALSAPSAAISGNATIASLPSTGLTVGGTLTVGNNATLSKDLAVTGNQVINGTSGLTVASSGSYGGGLTVANTLVVGNGIFTNGALTATLPSVFKSDLEVDGNLHVKKNEQVDGYLNVDGYIIANSSMTVSGDLVVTGSILNPPSVVNLKNGQLTPIPVADFPSTTPAISLGTTVQGIWIEYTIYRYNPGASSELAATGTLRAAYRSVANTWGLDDTYSGDNVHVTFTIDSLGRVNYASTLISPTNAGDKFIMKFRTRTINI